MKNHQRQVYVTQLHKVYNELSQAFDQVITDSNAVNLRESRYNRNGKQWFLSNYFKTTKTCVGDASEDCFADGYTNMNGTAIRTRDIIGSCSIAGILPSGASICLKSDLIIVDVNGQQGPNILGRDLFDFWVDDDGTLTVYDDLDDVDTRFSRECTANTDISYGYCLAKILNDGWKMDY